MREGDTIAAVATGSGEAGIAVVRISGPEAIAVADRVFRGRGRLESERGGRFLLGRVRAGDDSEADEVIALVYRAPHSYTREDVVELQCHGGRVAVRRVLRAALEAGARPAQPGEFTRRAFLNGRIDLAQAEAVADLIRARSDMAAAAALEQMEGRLSAEIAASYDALVALAAGLEASLDFEEGELPDGAAGERSGMMRAVNSGLKRLLDTWGEGHVLRDGALVVICGRPNAGKSTLLNALLGKDRAIVDREPGTTRDTLEEELVLEGVPLRLVDTAGLRDTPDRIEREGVDRARSVISRADMVLYVVDASEPLPGDERDFLAGASWPAALVVLNKLDIGRAVKKGDVPLWPVAECSLKTGSGLPEIKKLIPAALGFGEGREPHAVVSERHRRALQLALTEVEAADGEAADPVLSAWHLRRAAVELGTITGRDYSEELLDAVFSRFCVGK